MNAHGVRAQILLWVCGMGLALAACGRTPPAPWAVEGEPQPTGRPGAGNTAALSIRLIERIEESPAVDGGGPLDFGSAIALFGDTMAVGAPEQTGLGEQTGRVFLYRHEGDRWVQTGELVPGEEVDVFESDLNFGAALGLTAGTLVVGAPGARASQPLDDAGAVHVFQRRGAVWEQTGILHASDPASGARFGERIVLEEDVLLVQGGQAVYVFERDGDKWVERARLSGEDPGERDRFGISMDVDGDLLVVGAVEYDPELERYSSASVYLYRRDGGRWTLETRLAAGGGDAPAFGNALALQGETLVIGGGVPAAGYLAGSVHIYENGLDGWTPQARLVPADASIAHFIGFGAALLLQGDLLVVGAPGDSGQGLWSGSVYLFRRLGEDWVDVRKLWPDETDYLGAFFGADLELSENTLLVAAPAEFGNAVYLYQIDGIPLDRTYKSD